MTSPAPGVIADMVRDACKPKSAVVDDRTEVLREIAWSQPGFFHKHDLAPILTPEEMEAILRGGH